MGAGLGIGRIGRIGWRGSGARRPQPCKLAANETLRAEVEDKLAIRWSPQQISGWLKHTYTHRQEMWVSHETIYLTLFIQARGGMKRPTHPVFAYSESQPETQSCAQTSPFGERSDC